MMLACPGCGTVYEVAPARFGSRPRLVRCSACGAKWSYPPNSTPGRTPTSDPPAGGVERDAKAAGDAGQRPSTVELEKSAASVPIDSDADEATEPAPEPAVAEPDTPPAEAPLAESPPAATPPAEPTPSPADQSGIAAEVPKDPQLRLWQKIQLGPGLAAAVSATATVVGVLSLLFVLRGAVVASIPFSAGFYGLFGLLPDGPGAGLQIQDITSARQRRDGADVLTVSGVVSNIVKDPAVLPTIWITVLDDEDTELQSVSIENERASLAAGERLAFDKDIPNPSPRARRVRVSFMTPQPTPD